MGFLDKAKKLAQQAKDVAEQVKDMAEDAAAKAQPASKAPAASTASTANGNGNGSGSGMGTPYVEGMLGRPGWRESGLVDPAALLPVEERDRAGIPRSTKSVIVEEAYGMGRRWSAGSRSAGLFYRLHPEHTSWQAPGGANRTATLDDGRVLVFFDAEDAPVVLETSGLDPDDIVALSQAVESSL